MGRKSREKKNRRKFFEQLDMVETSLGIFSHFGLENPEAGPSQNGRTKISAQLVDFMEPVHRGKWTLAEFKVLLDLSVLVWNMVTNDPQTASGKIDHLIGKMKLEKEMAAAFKELMLDLRDRKISHFSTDERLIVSHSVSEKPNGDFLVIAAGINRHE